jgi:hypothetical protein
LTPPVHTNPSAGTTAYGTWISFVSENDLWELFFSCRRACFDGLISDAFFAFTGLTLFALDDFAFFNLSSSWHKVFFSSYSRWLDPYDSFIFSTCKFDTFRERNFAG